jgi:hypothetical protein
MTITLSQPRLAEVLQQHGVTPRDLAAIDRLFGGSDGYYWYQTLKQMCGLGQVLSWPTADALHAAMQAHENATAAEDDMKPQQLPAAQAEAIARLLQANG